jgi:hypothetical protein
VSVFPDELYPAPRSWAERAFPKLIHYNRLERGGHFAAWEQPQLFADELRAGFKQLRCQTRSHQAVAPTCPWTATSHAPGSERQHTVTCADRSPRASALEVVQFIFMEPARPCEGRSILR